MNKIHTQKASETPEVSQDQEPRKFGRYLYEDNGEFGDNKYADKRRDIAWTILGWELEPDEDTEWSGYYQRSDQILAIMVGDDRVFRFDLDDLTPIEEDDYCPGCGQMACRAYHHH